MRVDVLPLLADGPRTISDMRAKLPPETQMRDIFRALEEACALGLVSMSPVEIQKARRDLARMAQGLEPRGAPTEYVLTADGKIHLASR